MKIDLIYISDRFNKIKSDLLHSGYNGDYLYENIISALSEEILSELGEIENPDDVKQVLMNMFHLGGLVEKYNKK